MYKTGTWRQDSKSKQNVTTRNQNMKTTLLALRAMPCVEKRQLDLIKVYCDNLSK